MNVLTHGSLFAGIGGFDLGFERVGIQTIWQVEIDPYATKVLAKHWPNVRRYTDITTIDWRTVPRPDILSGGFPCQDISNAGKRAGITGHRSGLWGEFRKSIVSLRPRYVVVENVAALYLRGLNTVLRDLAESGYDAEWDCLPAAAIGAPHLRERIFIVAYPKCNEHRQTEPGISSQTEGLAGIPQSQNGSTRVVGRTGKDGLSSEEYVANTINNRLLQGDKVGCGDSTTGRDSQKERGVDSGIIGQGSKVVADTQSLHAQGRIYRPRERQLGRSGWWTTEPNVGRVAHGVSCRVDRLKCLGNAVVPQLAEIIGRMIVKAEGR